MKILVTGSKGFIGKNLIAELKYHNNLEMYEFDSDGSSKILDRYCQDCDFVFHLAGVNRPENTAEYMTGNHDCLIALLELLKIHHNTCPVMLSSSIQADLNNPYGKSKHAAEKALRSYAKETGSDAYIYRFPNLFGKWGQPNYNSVIATFCYNIARGYPIRIDNPSAMLELIYIDDVIQNLIQLLNGKVYMDESGFCYVPQVYRVTLGEIAELIYSFKKSREDLTIPNMEKESFSKKLYSTYLSYLPEQGFSYPLKMNEDSRGSFTEFIRTTDRGQISVNIIRPKMVKGNHWHHTKNEKFLVVSGKGVIQFRKPEEEKIISYHVSGETLEVVDIPVGYTHNIINIGNSDLIVLMWCNECFNSEHPDTYPLNVQGEI